MDIYHRKESQSNKPHLVDVVLMDPNQIHIKKRRFDHLESPFHFHDNNVYEMVWVEKSFGKRFIGDHIDDFEEGDLVLMGPQLPHKWINDNVFYSGNTDLYAQTTVLHFNGNLVSNLFENSEDRRSFDQLISHARRGIRLLGQNREEAISLINRLNHASGLKRVILFLQLIEIFCNASEFELLSSSAYKNSIDAIESKRMNDVYEYVMKKFQTAISLDEIATICCMTPTAFCRFFKAHRNLTFIEFLNEIRIGYACKLLRETELSITDICFQSGFNNTTNFNTFFKKVQKTTPFQYRANLHNLSNK